MPLTLSAAMTRLLNHPDVASYLRFQEGVPTNVRLVPEGLHGPQGGLRVQMSRLVWLTTIPTWPESVALFVNSGEKTFVMGSTGALARVSGLATPLNSASLRVLAAHLSLFGDPDGRTVDMTPQWLASNGLLGDIPENPLVRAVLQAATKRGVYGQLTQNGPYIRTTAASCVGVPEPLSTGTIDRTLDFVLAYRRWPLFPKELETGEPVECVIGGFHARMPYWAPIEVTTSAGPATLRVFQYQHQTQHSIELWSSSGRGQLFVGTPTILPEGTLLFGQDIRSEIRGQEALVDRLRETIAQGDSPEASLVATVEKLSGRVFTGSMLKQLCAAFDTTPSRGHLGANISVDIVTRVCVIGERWGIPLDLDEGALKGLLVVANDRLPSLSLARKYSRVSRAEPLEGPPCGKEGR